MSFATRSVTPPRARWYGALLLAMAIGAAACGSTVRQTEPSAGGEQAAVAPGFVPAPGSAGGADPVGSPARPPSTTSAPSAVGTTTAAPGSPSRPAGGGSGPVAGGGGAPTGTSPSPSSPAPAGGGPTTAPSEPGPQQGGAVLPSEGYGYTASEVRLGLGYLSSSTNSQAAGLGATGVAVGDTRQMMQIYVDDLNQRGGLTGRTVTPVFHEVDTTGDQRVEAQAACAAWTEDTTTFAALGPGAGDLDGVLIPCLAEHGTAWVYGPFSADTSYYNQYRQFLYGVPFMALDRSLRLLANSLAEQGFFDGPEVHVGLARNEGDAIERSVATGLVPALAAHGITIEAEAVVDSANMGTYAGAVSNTVLQFASQGITHVLFAAPGGLLPVTFMRQAESQLYRPRYGISTEDTPAVVQALAPAEQLANAIGFGTTPARDVADAQKPEPSQAAQECVAIYDRAGYDLDTNSLDRGLALFICDAFRLMEAALADATVPTPDTLEAGVDRLGELDSTTVLRAWLEPNRHDGARGYKHLVFDSACPCFVYEGDLAFSE